jgi:hypothetical protein
MVSRYCTSPDIKTYKYGLKILRSKTKTMAFKVRDPVGGKL